MPTQLIEEGAKQLTRPILDLLKIAIDELRFRELLGKNRNQTFEPDRELYGNVFLRDIPTL